MSHEIDLGSGRKESSVSVSSSEETTNDENEESDKRLEVCVVEEDDQMECKDDNVEEPVIAKKKKGKWRFNRVSRWAHKSRDAASPWIKRHRVCIGFVIFFMNAYFVLSPVMCDEIVATSVPVLSMYI